LKLGGWVVSFFETQCIFGRAAITFGIGPHSSYSYNALYALNIYANLPDDEGSVVSARGS